MFDTAFVARFSLVPLHPDTEGALLHFGVAYHWGKFSDDEAQLKSRPESSTAPFFVDTGVFPAERNNMLGLEAYFRKGNWLVGAEYLLNFIDGPQVDDPLVHGGEAYVSWIAFGGEQRPYVDLGGKLGFVSVKDSAFSGGKGALEAVLHFSYTDLDDGGISGGTFWRLTPQINWYIDDMVSLRVNYGLAHLDRFGVGEITQFYQARLQFQIQ